MDETPERIAAALERVLALMVNHPSDLSVTPLPGRGVVMLEISANPEDYGRIVGRKGRNFEALNTLAIAMSWRDRASYRVVVPDSEGNRD